MPVVFAVGPLCGTPAPTSARLSVVSRSPLTGTVYDCSAGGRFAWRLRAAGLLAILIEGKSPRPVVLAVTSAGEELLPAEALWTKGVGETVRALSDRGSVAAIGPAGENGVLFSNIMMGEGNAVGRGGLGAVLGRKNLKAVAVDGDLRTPIANRERFDRARADVMRLFRASPVLFGELGISEYGTPALVDLMRQRRMAPTENFRRTVFEDSSAYSGPAIRAAYGAKKEGCYGCPIRCKKSASDGRPLPEYETVSHFGALNAIADLHAIVRSNDACNDLGMDTISAAATLSALGEARGRFPLRGEIGPLLHDIAHRRGEGELLAEGLPTGGGGPRETGTLDDRQVAGAARLRPARGVRDGAGLRHQQPGRVPSAGVSHLPRDPSKAGGVGPVLLLGEGADDQDRGGRERGGRLPRGAASSPSSAPPSRSTRSSSPP